MTRCIAAYASTDISWSHGILNTSHRHLLYINWQSWTIYIMLSIIPLSHQYKLSTSPVYKWTKLNNLHHFMYNSFYIITATILYSSRFIYHTYSVSFSQRSCRISSLQTENATNHTLSIWQYRHILITLKVKNNSYKRCSV